MSRLRLSLGTCALVLSVAACQNAGITAPDSPSRDGIGGAGSGHRDEAPGIGTMGTGHFTAETAGSDSLDTTLYGIGMLGSGHSKVVDNGGTAGSGHFTAESDATATARDGIGMAGSGHRTSYNGGMAGSGERINDRSATGVAGSDSSATARNGGWAGTGH